MSYPRKSFPTFKEHHLLSGRQEEYECVSLLLHCIQSVSDAMNLTSMVTQRLEEKEMLT